LLPSCAAALIVGFTRLGVHEQENQGHCEAEHHGIAGRHSGIGDPHREVEDRVTVEATDEAMVSPSRAASYDISAVT